MSATSATCNPAISPDTPNATSSPASADGAMPCVSPDGPTTDPFGPEVVPASHSARRENKPGRKTTVTSGPSSSGSSASAALTLFLANRLRQRLDMIGSTLFQQTWREKATPSGRLYWVHTASVPRTAGSGCGSWPTPNAGPQNDGDTTWERRRKALKAKHKNGNGFGMTLGQAVSLASWPTPNAMPPNRGGLQSNPEKALERRKQGHMLNLDDAACLAGWPTPHTLRAHDSENTAGKVYPSKKQKDLEIVASWATPSARDWRSNEASEEHHQKRKEQTRGKPLKEQAHQLADSGTPPTGSPAATEKLGQLNPAHSRWLMGYPPGWDACAVMATPSSRKSRRNSSGQ